MTIKIDKKRYSLILSSGFEPVSVSNVRKTLRYLINGQGRALEPVSLQMFTFDEWVEKFYETNPEVTIKSEKLWMLIPEIVVLNRSKVHRKRTGTKCVNKSKVFERDKNICGYCQKYCNTKDRTIDHIHPVSKGGATDDYKNVVTCCKECNGIKGNKLLSEIGWTLHHKPQDPNETILHGVPRSKWLESWKTFLKVEMV